MKEYHYKIEPHPKGLGFIAFEYHGTRKTLWQSNNYCAVELCESAIKKRKETLTELMRINQKFNRCSYRYGASR